MAASINALASHPLIREPFDRANCGNILDRVDSRIKEVNGPHAGTDWREKQQMLAEIAKEFRYFKDAWRNHAMHHREYYDEPQALSVLNHVREFMQHMVVSGFKETP